MRLNKIIILYICPPIYITYQEWLRVGDLGACPDVHCYMQDGMKGAAEYDHTSCFSSGACRVGSFTTQKTSGYCLLGGGVGGWMGGGGGGGIKDTSIYFIAGTAGVTFSYD